jgi:hypothetical protein
MPWQREHWESRLGIDTNGECYDAIIEKIQPLIDGWLLLDKWLPIERLMIESWKKS